MATHKKPSLDLQTIRDPVDLAAKAIGMHKVGFTLIPEFIATASCPVNKLSPS